MLVLHCWSWLLLCFAAVHGLVCPDGSSCDDFATCCEILKGEYGCCPVPNAVCCDDQKHCCPSGYTCSQGTCQLLRRHSKSNSTDVCPGGEYSCPTGNTCCPFGDAYTCCPMPDATCCSDGKHCCPAETTCDLAHETCNVPIVSMANAVRSQPKLSTVVCPGETYQCPDGNTCCLMTTGEYGCCPLPDAVCCDDDIHCCPTGYTCEGGRCSQLRNTSAPSSPILKIENLADDNVVIRAGQIDCPDGSHCPDIYTCCLLSSGSYGCCPMPNAVCCDDHIHCCPQGTTCNPTAQKCDPGNGNGDEPTWIPWLEKVPASRHDPEHVNEV